MNGKHFLIGALALGLASQAQARVTYICPELQGSDLKVRVASGCVSTSMKYQGNDLALEVDQSMAAIYITGDIEYGGGGRIVTADCMGAKSFTLSAQGIDIRKYAVFYEGQEIGEADFLENVKPDQCLGTKMAKSVQSGRFFSSHKHLFDKVMVANRGEISDTASSATGTAIRRTAGANGAGPACSTCLTRC